jgi:hypothetical protein
VLVVWFLDKFCLDWRGAVLVHCGGSLWGVESSDGVKGVMRNKERWWTGVLLARDFEKRDNVLCWYAPPRMVKKGLTEHSSVRMICLNVKCIHAGADPHNAVEISQ